MNYAKRFDQAKTRATKRRIIIQWLSAGTTAEKASVTLAALETIKDKYAFADIVFALVRQKHPCVDPYRALLASDIAQVKLQPSEAL